MANSNNLDNKYDAFCGRLFSLLKEKQITQKEFAKKLDVSPQTVTDWKKGKSHSFLDYTEAIVKILGTTSDWLLLGHDPRFALSEKDKNNLDIYCNNLSVDDLELIRAFHAADDRAREIVRLTLKPFGLSEFADEAM